MILDLGLVIMGVNIMLVFEFTKLCAYSPHFLSYSLQVLLMERRDGTHWRDFWMFVTYDVLLPLVLKYG